MLVRAWALSSNQLTLPPPYFLLPTPYSPPASSFELSIDAIVDYVKYWADAYIESDAVQRFVVFLHHIMGR